MRSRRRIPSRISSRCSTSSTGAARAPGRSSIATTRSGSGSSSRQSGSTRSSDRAIAECRERTLQHITLPPTRAVHRRVRHEQAVERLQLVSGQLPQPDPGQHRPADLHRPRDRSGVPRRLPRAPRLQRAAREEPGPRSRLGRILGVPAVLAAVADCRRHRQLRHRGRVPGRRTRGVRARRAVPGGRAGSVARPANTTRCRRWSISSSYAGNEAARQYLNGEIDATGGGDVAGALRDDAAGSRRAARPVLRHSTAAT